MEDYLTTVKPGDSVERNRHPQFAAEQAAGRRASLLPAGLTLRADDADAANGVSGSDFLVGTITERLVLRTQAIEAFRRAIEIGEGRFPRMPVASPTPSNSDSSTRAWATTVRSGRLEDAESAFAIAQRLLEGLRGDDPENSGLLDRLDGLYGNLGALKQDQGQQEEAVAFYGKSMACCEQVLATDPDNADAQNGLAAALHNLAGIDRETGKQEESARRLTRAIAIREKLAQAAPCGILIGRRNWHSATPAWPTACGTSVAPTRPLTITARCWSCANNWPGKTRRSPSTAVRLAGACRTWPARTTKPARPRSRWS